MRMFNDMSIGKQKSRLQVGIVYRVFVRNSPIRQFPKFQFPRLRLSRERLDSQRSTGHSRSIYQYILLRPLSHV
jgi:hypothetical protein